VLKNENRLFDIVKASVLHCKTGAFVVQNRRFYNAKQWVLQHVDKEMVTQ
jgi:hypothetical protein